MNDPVSELEKLLEASVLMAAQRRLIKHQDAYIGRLQQQNDDLRRQLAKVKRLESLNNLAADIRKDVRDARPALLRRQAE
jgi:hypothetical protein